MAEQLVIYLKDLNTLEADWVFSHQNGEITTPLSSGSISELVDKNKNSILSVQKITVIIYAEHIHLSYQNIPAKNRQRALQAIPFALEEQLADDIDLLHFATSSPQKNIYPVAAIKHETIRNILDKLKEFKITPDNIHADISCLPQDNNSWNLFSHQNNISIDQHKNSVIYADTGSFAIILNQLLQQTDENQLPDTINIWSDSDTSTLQLPTTIPENIKIIQHEYKQSPLSTFSKYLTQKNIINLLQGPYKVVSQTDHWWKAWKIAAALAVISISFELISGGIQLNRLESESKSIGKEITRIYKKSFPRSKRIVNTRVQMENKLKQLRKNNTKGVSSFIDLLASTSPVIQQTNGIKIQAINFSNKKLEIQFSIDKLSSVDSLKSRLNKLPNIKAEIVSASSEATSVNAKITIEAI
jgi:general secretion pathway protein L